MSGRSSAPSQGVSSSGVAGQVGVDRRIEQQIGPAAVAAVSGDGIALGAIKRLIGCVEASVAQARDEELGEPSFFAGGARDGGHFEYQLPQTVAVEPLARGVNPLAMLCVQFTHHIGS